MQNLLKISKKKKKNLFCYGFQSKNIIIIIIILNVLGDIIKIEPRADAIKINSLRGKSKNY